MMALSTQIVRSSSSFPSSSTFPSSYDAFISFCGADTRNGFVDHLYADFQRKGLIVFKDDKKLERGNFICDELLEAIKNSQYAIVVISKNFACSKWCLLELDKIMECETEKRLKVLPVFYHIDPSEVQKQQQIFAQAFAKHKQDPDVGEEHRTAWSTALRKVSKIAGWHVKPFISAEATVVKEITRSIFRGLQLNSFKISKDLVGIESRVEEVEKELCLEMDDVQYIGIYGMAGIGKTTLAKVLFETVRYEFDASCFVCCGIENRVWKLQQQIVREILGERNLKIHGPIHGIELLKTKVHNKRVFVVLDDVNRNQLEQLAGDPSWFGQGSRIIVIGKDHQLLKPYVNKTYEVKPLDDGDAMELFCWKAFKNPHPKLGYRKLVKKIMGLVKGHPLALAIIGSSLYEKGMEVWIGVRDILKVDSSGEILKKLEISYLMLGDTLKKYFLDIACFGGWFVDILKLFDPSTSLHIGALEDKSLINTRFGEVVMHDLLRKLGQRVVYQLSPMEPGNRSRLWVGQDIIHVLRNDSGTDAIEGIICDHFFQPVGEVSYEGFSRMKRLTMLILIWHSTITMKWIGDSSKFILSKELRVIRWEGFPLKSLSNSFQSDNLVELCLPYSGIRVLWIGKKSFGQLKNIKLSFSKYLLEIPDLTGVPNLMELDLEGCASLWKVHPSIANLSKLVRLNLRGCQRLKALPKKIYLESLKSLDLGNCSRLENFPTIGSHMTSLVGLSLCNTSIKRLPLPSMRSLSSLRDLDISGCPIGRPIEFEWFFKTNPPYFHRRIDLHPQSICYLSWLRALSSLTKLDLSDCNISDSEIPNDISCLSLLKELNLSKNIFTKIPEGITQLSNLKILIIDHCQLLQSLSTWLPSCLSSLSYPCKVDINLLDGVLPIDLSNYPFSNLETLATYKHHLLQSLSTSLSLGFSSLSHPSKVDMSLNDCNLLDAAIPYDLGCLSWAMSLDLSENQLMTLPNNFCLLNKLEFLDLSYCSQLQELPKFPLSLRNLEVESCPLLEMDCYQMDVRKLPLCISVWFSVATNIGYNGTPYKILQLNERHLLGEIEAYEFSRGDMFAWGPTQEFEIPMWFNHRSINLFQKIQCHVDVASKYKKMGLALFVAYQVHENSNSSISGDTNPMLPEFVWRFQAYDICQELLLVFHVTEVSFVIPNGFWAYIPDLLFKKKGMDLHGCHYLETSIETNNFNVEVKECGVRLLHEHNVPEFFDVLASITPHGLELKNLKDFDFRLVAGF